MGSSFWNVQSSGKEENQTTVDVTKMTVAVSALKVFRDRREHVTERPDLVCDRKALLCKSDVQIEF